MPAGSARPRGRAQMNSAAAAPPLVRRRRSHNSGPRQENLCDSLNMTSWFVAATAAPRVPHLIQTDSTCLHGCRPPRCQTASPSHTSLRERLMSIVIDFRGWLRGKTSAQGRPCCAADPSLYTHLPPIHQRACKAGNGVAAPLCVIILFYLANPQQNCCTYLAGRLVCSIDRRSIRLQGSMASLTEGIVRARMRLEGNADLDTVTALNAWGLGLSGAVVAQC